MSALLKDIYSREFYDSLAKVLAVSLAGFDANEFIERIFVAEFDQLELKQRMSHTTRVLHSYLSDDFIIAAASLCKLIDELRARDIFEQVIEFMFLPDYIKIYGIDNYDEAVKTLEFVTQYSSCELAVRPFIIKYGRPMLKQMLQWSQHENKWVRRLASEGCRPRLPWAMALAELKRDPTPILPILENLKDDESETVRRSVANNMNDISKDNPDVVVALARRWIGRNPQTDALVKHGCRSLLKQGHTDVLELFGFDAGDLDITPVSVRTPRVDMGAQLEFGFTINNRSTQAKPLRIEYAIYLLKKNGQLSKKVFKISERDIDSGGQLTTTKQHRFKPITTRVYYSGRHQIAVIVNGQEGEPVDFDLVV